MVCDLVALCIDARDPDALASFWAGVLHWELSTNLPGGTVDLVPDDDTGFRMRFVPCDVPRRGLNRMHPDLTSTSWSEQRKTVERSLRLGAQHLDVGQRSEEDHVVLADPEGNEYCVIEPGNGFLADCGFLGALAGDGTHAVGHFWSEALGWPLVWDQDDETAIRSPHGGPKLSWGGPPVAPQNGRNRWRLLLTPSAGDDLEGEVERLLSLGATRLERDGGDGQVVLADPDGNGFSLLATSQDRTG